MQSNAVINALAQHLIRPDFTLQQNKALWILNLLGYEIQIDCVQKFVVQAQA